MRAATTILQLSRFLGTLSLSGTLTAATVTGVSPPLGHPGDVVQVNGSGFDTTPSNHVVRFGPNRAAVFTATPIQLTYRSPMANRLAGSPEQI